MTEHADVPADDPRLDPDAALHRTLDEATVTAVGKVTEALEVIEAARGHLYQFHRLTGTADLTLGAAVEALREAGHPDLADRLDRELVGRNVLPGRWTFQVVEDYDRDYYRTFQRLEQEARVLTGGHRHLAEAAMKRARTTPGHPAHAPTPN